MTIGTAVAVGPGGSQTSVVGETNPEAGPSAEPSPSVAAIPPRPAPSGILPPARPLPAGMRLVGVGRIAVAVPAEWKPDQYQCSTPVRDTWSVFGGGFDACGHTRPQGVEEVRVEDSSGYGYGVEFAPSTTFRWVEIDGVQALRTATECSDAGALEPNDPATCWAAVRFPDDELTLTFSSSTDAARIDALVQELRVVPDGAGVPDYAGLPGEDFRTQFESYLERLELRGLVPDVEYLKENGTSGGYVKDVAPVPGTVLTRGDTVRVVAFAEPETPAEAVSVSVVSRPAAAGLAQGPQLDDAQSARARRSVSGWGIRSGPTPLETGRRLSSARRSVGRSCGTRGRTARFRTAPGSRSVRAPAESPLSSRPTANESGSAPSPLSCDDVGGRGPIRLPSTRVRGQDRRGTGKEPR